MDNSITFGSLIKEKRLSKEISLRKFAKEIGITAPYLSDVENGARKPFDAEKIQKIVIALDLNSQEAELLNTLAGKERNSMAPDVIQYVNSNSQFAPAFRKAKDMNVTEEEWMEMLKMLEEKRSE